MTAKWTPRLKGTQGLPAGLIADQMIQYRLAGDPSTYNDEAGNLMWADGPGCIAEYRMLVPAPAVPEPAPRGGVGDVNGKALGTAARFNASKPDLSLIPAGIFAAVAAYGAGPSLTPSIHWGLVTARLGDFQMREDGREALYHALQIMDNDGQMWAECARVFEYGKEKYSPWNWARGQAWSIPIASALRHIVFGLPLGPLDSESGLPHRGHIACNIVMLLWFFDHYPEGDDRYAPPLPHA